jgi:hypothetical protein
LLPAPCPCQPDALVACRLDDGGVSRPGAVGTRLAMTDRGPASGELEGDKRGDTSEPPHPQPSAAEVESARQLENEAAPRLEGAGLSREEVRRLADEFVALDLGEDTDDFAAWALERHGA